jgi:hypothetical protein
MSISGVSSNASNYLPSKNQQDKAQSKKDAHARAIFGSMIGTENDNLEHQVDATTLAPPPPPEDICDQSAIDELWNELQGAIRSAKKQVPRCYNNAGATTISSTIEPMPQPDDENSCWEFLRTPSWRATE